MIDPKFYKSRADELLALKKRRDEILNQMLHELPNSRESSIMLSVIYDYIHELDYADDKLNSIIAAVEQLQDTEQS
ncbi:MAG: hypothetical protein IJ575_07800 [Selenomonadaceae bacterium]|nr:hypothetical protein [Selenomonadaceae bacterium]